MNKDEFEQFVWDNGKDILRFCRMLCGGDEAGDELYQDTMLKLLGKRKGLNFEKNVKSYALSVAILLWRNKKKKYANRKRLMPLESIESIETEGSLTLADITAKTPESYMIQKDERIIVQQVVAQLPEKYRMPIHLYYSADLSIREIAQILQIPEGTVKSRMNKAKRLLNKELEALGYDR